MRLRSAEKSIVREALLAAWRNRAPKSLARQLAQISGLRSRRKKATGAGAGLEEGGGVARQGGR